MRIIIDGDACPVKDIIINETLNKHIQVLIVSSFSHYSDTTLPKHVKELYVDSGPDSVDFKIVSLSTSHDIIVTQDYGLASLLLAKQCIVLHHTGFQYTTSNINELLNQRYIHANMRKQGQRTKGPSPLTLTEKNKFKHLLQSFLITS